MYSTGHELKYQHAKCEMAGPKVVLARQKIFGWPNEIENYKTKYSWIAKTNSDGTPKFFPILCPDSRYWKPLIISWGPWKPRNGLNIWILLPQNNKLKNFFEHFSIWQTIQKPFEGDDQFFTKIIFFKFYFVQEILELVWKGPGKFWNSPWFSYPVKSRNPDIRNENRQGKMHYCTCSRCDEIKKCLYLLCSLMYLHFKWNPTL